MLDGRTTATYVRAMSEISISLPSDLQRWIDSRVSAGAYVDPADYVRDLLRRDQDDHVAEVGRVRGLIDQGLASGIVDAAPEAVLDRIIADITPTHG